MAQKTLIFNNFTGGLSTSKRLGIKDSFAGGFATDFRKLPGQFSTLPGLVREDSGNVEDLILNEVMTDDGTIYAFGNKGFIYKRTTAGAWSNIGNMLAGTGGVDYRKDTDSLYFTSTKFVGTYAPLSKTPLLTSRMYGPSFSTFNPVNPGLPYTINPFQQSSTNTTAILTAFTENTSAARYFQSDIEPLNKISLFVVTKGTGDWTLTLHDGLNNVLGTSTVTNANLQNGAFNDFNFTTAPNAQVRIYVAPNARTYHLHVTSTVSDGTVSSSQINDLSTCDLEVWADRLVVTNNGLHPIQRFLQYETFGNGNYLSIWEPLSDPPTNDEWLRHKLVFPMEYEVNGLASQNEFLVIAAERKTTNATSDPQAGILFFWDGTSTTYNFDVPIPEGSPQSLHTYKNVVYYYAGGAWYALSSAQSQPVKLRTMPDTDTEFSGTNSPITVYPSMATVRRGIHLWGWPSLTTNTGVNFGVYSWGAIDKNYPDAFGYSYLLSTGNQNYSVSNNLQVGMVKSFGDILHVSWHDGTSSDGGYGIDAITNASKPAATSLWQSLVFDNGYAAKLKYANYMEAYYSIPDGCSITLGYSINSADFVIDSNMYTTTNLFQGQLGYARFNISDDVDNGGRFNEIQVQLQIECDSTVSIPPVIQMVSLVYNDARENLTS